MGKLLHQVGVLFELTTYVQCEVSGPRLHFFQMSVSVSLELLLFEMDALSLIA